MAHWPMYCWFEAIQAIVVRWHHHVLAQQGEQSLTIRLSEVEIHTQLFLLVQV